jgi:23S rRNA pseudouridine1911/1915/1917 synthase
MNINILYEDEDIIVCVKPAGVAVQTKRLGQADMESLLKNYIYAKDGVPGQAPYIGVVHRLDQPVSGVMVFAKTKEAAAALGRQMQGKLIEKYYYALTDGVPDKKKGSLEDYLLRDGKNNISSVVPKGTKDAKRAALKYEVIESDGSRALIKVELETGRHHQIRVQLSHAGWPIVGDLKYNFKENMKPSGSELALCSYHLGFRHPAAHKKMEFEIEPPAHIDNRRDFH